jgi:site-specific recombinase XerD
MPNDRPELCREVIPPLVSEFLEALPPRAVATHVVYGRVLRQLVDWIAARPGSEGDFRPNLLTTTALSVYLEELGAKGYRLNHRTRVNAVTSRFARWLIEEKALLSRSPARQAVLPPQQHLAPRALSPDQRYVLRDLAERDGTARRAALFALGYWAGCRVSDVAHLTPENTHVGPKLGWIRVGHKGGKMRDIDLVNQARQALHQYITQVREKRKETLSPCGFLSQRHERRTESGIHQCFRAMKVKATRSEAGVIEDVTFHDLRHDFAHRARSAGWSLEETAYYLGHVTRQ